MTKKAASIEEWARATGLERVTRDCRSCSFPDEVKARIEEADAAGWGPNYISRYLAEVFDIEIHPATLRNHIKNHIVRGDA